MNPNLTATLDVAGHRLDEKYPIYCDTLRDPGIGAERAVSNELATPRVAGPRTLPLKTFRCFCLFGINILSYPFVYPNLNTDNTGNCLGSNIAVVDICTKVALEPSMVFHGEISAPFKRPATSNTNTFSASTHIDAPAALLMARLKAIRRSSWLAMFSATNLA